MNCFNLLNINTQKVEFRFHSFLTNFYKQNKYEENILPDKLFLFLPNGKTKIISDYEKYDRFNTQPFEC